MDETQQCCHSPKFTVTREMAETFFCAAWGKGLTSPVTLRAYMNGLQEFANKYFTVAKPSLPDEAMKRFCDARCCTGISNAGSRRLLERFLAGEFNEEPFVPGWYWIAKSSGTHMPHNFTSKAECDCILGLGYKIGRAIPGPC